MSEDTAKSGDSSKESNVDPPPLSVDLPLMRQITTTFKQPHLPIDVLLLTANKKEFLACYKELKDPFRCYYDGTGHVYFSNFVGGRQAETVKVALMKCYQGAVVPGGSLTAVKNAASILKPKAVISVGTCSGLDPKNTKLGDVVVSAKLTTRDMRTYVSKRFLWVILHCDDGWIAPHHTVKVHRGEFLSGSELVRADWLRNILVKRYPEATAIEIGGDGKCIMYIIALFLVILQDQFEKSFLDLDTLSFDI